jgi:hypothetical protein
LWPGCDRILLVEQAGTEKFNRCAFLNAGFFDTWVPQGYFVFCICICISLKEASSATSCTTSTQSHAPTSGATSTLAGGARQVTTVSCTSREFALRKRLLFRGHCLLNGRRNAGTARLPQRVLGVGRRGRRLQGTRLVWSGSRGSARRGRQRTRGYTIGDLEGLAWKAKKARLTDDAKDLNKLKQLEGWRANWEAGNGLDSCSARVACVAGRTFGVGPRRGLGTLEMKVVVVRLYRNRADVTNSAGGYCRSQNRRQKHCQLVEFWCWAHTHSSARKQGPMITGSRGYRI